MNLRTKAIELFIKDDAFKTGEWISLTKQEIIDLLRAKNKIIFKIKPAIISRKVKLI